jgi:protein OS-9
VKGDQRYLVQRLDSGTTCDLTGRDRTIEVQFHCAPGMKADRIGWIKEITTCAYLMVVNTPRLCDDVAFLPPEETTANAITCALIIPTDAKLPDSKTRAARKTLQSPEDVPESEKKADTPKPQTGSGAQRPPVVIGGVLVGGRRVITADADGKSAVKLEPPSKYLAPAGRRPVVEVVASKEQGKPVKEMTVEQLQKLDLKPELVEDMKRELEKIAGDKGWKLEVVDGNPREIRGVVDYDGETTEEEEKRRKNTEDESGSEEHFFKEEL